MVENLRECIDRVSNLSAYATYKEKLTNTFGVVVECDAPRLTSGPDLLQTIRLVDESCPDGVALCIFAQQADAMPRAQLGDILELRNVVVQFWRDRPQLFGKMSKPHCFGFLLYRTSGAAVQAADAQPVQLWNTTADSHHAAERLPHLQALKKQAIGHATVADAALPYLRRIKDLAPAEEQGQRPACVDMRVRVLAIDKRRASDEVIIYVWDATDAKPACASLQMPPSEYKGTQLPLLRPCRHVMPLQSEPPGLQVLQELPPIGTALPVVMDSAAVPSTGLPQVGDWVKIKVVGVAAVQGQWQVVFGKVSRLTQCQPTPAFETWYKTRLDTNDCSEWPHDLSKVATSCSLPSLPRITIRQMMLKAAQRQPGPFRVQMRLIGHLPQELLQWCKMRPQDSGAEPVWEWAAHLWLEDATGDVRALLLGQEGTKLLGLAPQCLANGAVVQQLQSRLQYLATVDDDGGVWIDAALTPLYSAQQHDQHSPQGQQQQQTQQEQRQSRSGQAAEPEQQQVAQHPAVADQVQENVDQGQLHIVPVGQQQEVSSQQQQPLEADPGAASLERETQQQLAVRAGGAPLPPVFVLHDAVLIEKDWQEHDAAHHDQQWLQGSLSHHEQSGQQQDLLQLRQGSPEQELQEHESHEQQAGRPQGQQHEQQQQPDGADLPAASPLTGHKRRLSEGCRAW